MRSSWLESVRDQRQWPTIKASNMRVSELSVAIAVGRSLWWRSRRGFMASAASVLAMALLYPWVFSHTRGVPIVLISVLPLLGVFGFVFNSILYAEEPGNMTSSYPKPTLVLPVRSRSLALWPMFYAALAGAVVWLATAGLLYRPSGFAVPLFLPALGLAAALAWVSALSWLPIAEPWIRVGISIGSIAAMAALPGWLYRYHVVSGGLIALILGGYILAAYGLGLAAVSCARRGDVWRFWPDAGWSLPSALRSSEVLVGRPFRSAAAAQRWYEWRCHGQVLPLVVAFVLVVITLIKLHAGSRNNEFVLPIILATFLGMPIIQASCVSTGLGRFTPLWIKRREFITFAATRPIPSGELVSAKLRMMLPSVLLTWLIVLPGLGLWIVASGNSSNVAWMVRKYVAQHGTAQALALSVLGLVFLPAWTWKQATDGLAASITGRSWIEGCYAFVASGTILGLIAAGLRFVTHPDELAWFLRVLPRLVTAAAVTKGVVTGASFWWALGRRYIAWHGLLISLGTWAAFTSGGIAMLALSLPQTPLPVGRPVLFLAVATFAPLARYPLATLAADWNRHR
jgi:hypothetical protein